MSKESTELAGKHPIATVAVFLLASVASSGAVAAAPVCDLRTALPANYPTCSVGQGLFDTDEHRPIGAGFIDSFLRIQTVSTNTIPGTVYREFFLGADETAATNKGRSFITLDQLEIYVSNAPGLNPRVKKGNKNAVGALSGVTKVYDMDTASDDVIQIAYRLSGPFSGLSHSVFYVPSSLSGHDRYVDLYSQFGNIDDADHPADSGLDDGFVKSAGQDSSVSSP
jgi:hypothetical protein